MIMTRSLEYGSRACISGKDLSEVLSPPEIFGEAILDKGAFSDERTSPFERKTTCLGIQTNLVQRSPMEVLCKRKL